MFATVEKFVSINGESSRAGEPAVFIRFRGCDLDCTYCDTKWANVPDCLAEMLTAQEIADYCDGTGITDVTLTGGEPLLQDGLEELVTLLAKSGHRVEIETNGAQPIERLAGASCRPAFTLDYKLPGSGMESAMLTENYAYLRECDAVKFVAGSTEDLERAAEIIARYRLSEKCSVFISPVFGSIDPREIVEFMTDRKLNGVRLQLQLHKFIWSPDQRGV